MKNYLHHEVLGETQIEELVDLGLDFSTSLYDLESILMILPSQLIVEGYTFDLVIGPGLLMYFDWTQGRTLVEIKNNSLLEAAFGLLKWSLINNHIKK
jgi:hypothetical protein